MSDDVFRKHKLSDALTHGQAPPDTSLESGAPQPTHATAAEQTREGQEGQQAHNAQGGMRDRLVDIGKANHMAGRGNGRRSDQ